MKKSLVLLGTRSIAWYYPDKCLLHRIYENGALQITWPKGAAVLRYAKEVLDGGRLQLCDDGTIAYSHTLQNDCATTNPNMITNVDWFGHFSFFTIASYSMKIRV